MTQKIYHILQKVYAISMFTSFFAGFIPVIPFIIALLVGGDFGAGLYNFFFKQYYPWVIALGSFSIVIGMIAMYVGKIEDLSLKSMKNKDKDAKS